MVCQIKLWLYVLVGVCSCFAAEAVARDILFLHHSTGAGVYYEGGVPEWIADYNAAHATDYRVAERSYPDSPYPWENYPYDYWNLWLNAACDAGNPAIECLDTLTRDYDVIIFKHCFPGAAIQADSGTPDVNSPAKTLENYKVQYRALRALMDGYRDNLFIVWTLAPLHRLATDSSEAARAREFVDWVTNDFLSEDGTEHLNIALFDFWGIVAEDDPAAVTGKVNCLKYAYEGSHFSSDSHPNAAANQAAGPQFAQTIVTELERYFGENGDGDDGGDNGTDPSDGDGSGDDGDGTDDCPAVTVMGADSPGLAVLRTWRDTVLAQSVAGKALIAWYYDNAAAVAAALRTHPHLRRAIESAARVLPQPFQP